MINKFKFKTNLHIIFIFLSFVFHLIASYTSIGFYAMDEHFQILEPLAHKLDLRDVHVYEIWELGNGLRPWTQVYIFYFIIQVLKFFSINNPFIWIIFIQMILSILGFTSIYLLYNLLIKKKIIIKTYFNTYIYFFFWFLIFFHARTSSENFSMSIFIIGLVMLFSLDKVYNNKFYFFFILTGFLFGLSILIRYQLIFILIPFFLWLWIYYFNFIKVFLLGLLIIISLIFGLIIDYFGYGNFINTYYNYFYFNLVVGIFDGFGIEPWWYYISELIIKFSPPLGLFFLLGILLFWFRNKSHFLTWITLPYFLLFTYLGHKELRFIFPLLLFLPIFIIYLLDNIKKYKLFKTVVFAKSLIIIANSLFLFAFIIPAERQIALQRFVANNMYKAENVYFYDKNPYRIDGMNPYFYTHYLPEIKKFDLEIDYKKFKNSKLIYYLITNDYLFYKNHFKDNKLCKKIYNSYPEKFVSINKNWKNRNLNWFIIKCDNYL